MHLSAYLLFLRIPFEWLFLESVPNNPLSLHSYLSSGWYFSKQICLEASSLSATVHFAKDRYCAPRIACYFIMKKLCWDAEEEPNYKHIATYI